MSGIGPSREADVRPTLRWWTWGIIGGISLSLLTLIKGLAAVLFLRPGEWDATAAVAPLLTFGMGFICGSLAGLLRGLSRRMGLFGDAMIGAVVADAYFLCCMFCFCPQMLTGEEPGRGQMLLGATLLGMICGPWFGRDFRRDFADPSS